MFSTSKKAIIFVSDRAWEKMSDVLKPRQRLGIVAFKFSAKSGGCNGFNYNLETIDKSQFDDVVHEAKMPPTVINNGDTRVVIDPWSEMFLIGTTIDYIKEDYSKNIFESKFTFTPKKELATTCGCGISFTPNNFWFTCHSSS